MTTLAVADTVCVLESPLVPVLIRLADEGFRFRLLPSGLAQVSPASRLPADVAALFQARPDDLRVLVALATDTALHARRDAFLAQRDAAAADAPLPAFVFVPDMLPTRGGCFSCGEALGSPSAVGRCWRCALAWRLVMQAPIDAATAIPRSA